MNNDYTNNMEDFFIEMEIQYFCFSKGYMGLTTKSVFLLIETCS